MTHRTDVYPVQRGLGWLCTSLATLLLGFMVKREMVMDVTTLQEFYKSLMYFLFIGINATFNQLTDLKNNWHIYPPLDINTASVSDGKLSMTQLIMFPWITPYRYHLTMQDTASTTRSGCMYVYIISS